MKTLLLCCVYFGLSNQFLDKDYCAEEKKMIQQGLVDIQTIDPSVLVELKYSTTDNFMKKDVYGAISHCFLQKMAAQKLKKASQILQAQYPDLRLLVYDGARSRTVQYKLWNALPQLSTKNRKNYVADPAIGSIHNYGCAIDLTLANTLGQALDMGTPYDFFGPLAYPRLENLMLVSKKLSQKQLDNRKILRQAMTQAGFMPITSEWWHFNALSRNQARQQYTLIE